jgi:RHS repeat-associated protein
LVNYTYSAFGQRTVTGDATQADAFGFTGREHDSETGLLYYRARYMDPGLGRFTSEDPIGFASADYNLGRYVGNSPLNGIDSSGLITKADYQAVKAAAVAAARKCAHAIGVKIVEKGVEIGIYMFLAEFKANTQIYVGHTLDEFENRKKAHNYRLAKKKAIEFVKLSFEPVLRVAKGTGKDKIKKLEEFFIRYVEKNLGAVDSTGKNEHILNKRHATRKDLKFGCDDFVK